MLPAISARHVRRRGIRLCSITVSFGPALPTGAGFQGTTPWLRPSKYLLKDCYVAEPPPSHWCHHRAQWEPGGTGARYRENIGDLINAPLSKATHTLVVAPEGNPGHSYGENIQGGSDRKKCSVEILHPY